MIAMEDRNDVKQAIMKYGAAATLINSNQSPQYFNSEHSAYYNYESQDTDHDIAVVGWDDDFSVNNFGLDDGWDGTAATSAPLISADESKDVTFDSHGIAWVRFEPATSGFLRRLLHGFAGKPAEQHHRNCVQAGWPRRKSVMGKQGGQRDGLDLFSRKGHDILRQADERIR